MSIFLSAGILNSPTCTIGDYRIDWRLGSITGDIVFISGEGIDIDLQAIHPFTDEVVKSGDLYPVIAYVYISGDKVTSAYEIGEIFSPDLLSCLDFVTIDAIDCDTLYGNDGSYNFRIIYNNTTTNQQNKSRVFSYNIGASTNFIAWKFYADDIADGIQISYCTAIDPIGTLIDNYIFGSESSPGVPLITDLSPVSYPTNPRVLNYLTFTEYVELRQITDVTGFTYVAGDYLKVEIIGSVLDPTNNNTNWTVNLMCLDSFDNTTFNSQDIARIDGGVTPTIYFVDTPTCRYYVDYKTLEIAENPRASTSNEILKYLTVMARFWSPQTGGALGSSDMDEDNGLIILPYKITYYYGGFSLGSCRDLLPAEVISVEDTNGNYKITFPNVTEYNKMVADIAATQASSQFIASQVANPVTDGQYYGGYNLDILKATSCGDTQIRQYTYIHHTSVISYDAGNRVVEFTMPIITNQYPGPASCTSPYGTIDSHVTYVNARSTQTGTYDTGVALTDYVTQQWLISNNQFDDVVVQHRWYKIPAILHDHVISPAQLTTIGFCLDGDYWWFYKQYDRVTFTDPSTPESRLTNWTLERQKQLRTGVCTDTFIEGNYELVHTEVPTTTTTTTI